MLYLEMGLQLFLGLECHIASGLTDFIGTEVMGPSEMVF
jgi:hypothetical protein